MESFLNTGAVAPMLMNVVRTLENASAVERIGNGSTINSLRLLQELAGGFGGGGGGGGSDGLSAWSIFSMLDNANTKSRHCDQCYDAISHKHVAAVLVCGHVFHASCVAQNEPNPSCPVCDPNSQSNVDSQTSGVRDEPRLLYDEEDDNGENDYDQEEHDESKGDASFLPTIRSPSPSNLFAEPMMMTTTTIEANATEESIPSITTRATRSRRKRKRNVSFE
jgi:hypothetical protein